ncbi:hypothetical protein N9P38_00935 [Flavobacteriales bacterium]|nr:hypothetical protein [Flavobacteriales bacterium]MDB4088906.1 hypothetical protein [Flavobacteriales bacterium]
MKRLNKLIIILVNLFISLNLSSQIDLNSSDTVFDGHVVSSDWIDKGVTIGVNYSHYLYGEIDFYKSNIWEAGGFPVVSNTMNYGIEFSYLEDLIVAPKIQGRLHAYFFNTSLSILYYSDLKNSYALKLRPEIGLGLWNIDINYGYNIGLFKNGFEKSNKHVISLRYYLNLNRKYLNEYDRNGNVRPESK